MLRILSRPLHALFAGFCLAFVLAAALACNVCHVPLGDWGRRFRRRHAGAEIPAQPHDLAAAHG